MENLKNYLQQPYARIVIPTEGSGFHAEILEFPGCFAQGSTVEEAYANLESAAKSWIETCLAQGQEIPGPTSNLTFSGRIALRLPRGIHRQAARMALRDQISLNSYLVSAVSAKVGAEDFYGTLATRMEQHVLTTVTTFVQEAIDFLSPMTSSRTVIKPLPILSETASNTANNIPNPKLKKALAEIGR